jgi:DNA-binding NarL/FixJ family response regulator
MTVRIAVSDPLPMFQRGILETLGDADVEPETPEDLLTWARQPPRRVVLLTIQSSNDWELLAELRKSGPDLVVIALLTDETTPSYVRAILAGAIAAVPRDAAPDKLKDVFEAAIAGSSLLPTEVVRALASASQELPTESPTTPSAREIEWLRMLAQGATVAQLADRFGYSERAMFRLLRDLYQRMQVGSRTAALMRAQERGWL